MAISAVAGLATAIGAAAVPGALAFFTLTGFSAFAAWAALGAGLSMVSRALAPKPNLGAQMRGITQTTREPAGSRKVVYGKMRVGGQVVFISNSGDDNKYLHMAIAFASHEIESYEEIWFNDKKVWTLSGGFQSDWGTYVTIDRKFGTDAQAASTDLVNANVLWTTNHKLSGIAYIAFRLEWDTDKFPQGVPNITAVLKGKKVYDPRTSSTGWSQNPALCLRDYILDDKYGLGEVTANIDSTALTAAANLCEEQVTLDAGGTQDRYQCNGVIETGNQIRANIEQLLASMGGMLTYSGGKYFIDGAEYKTPTLTFTEADVISDIQTQTKQSRRGVYNGVKGIFVSEEKNYKVLDYPPQISSTYATEDGDPIYLDMALPFVTNNTQAQRLAKIALLKSRQQVVINMTVNLKGLQVKIGDTINVTNDRLNYSSKVFQVIDYSLAIADGGALAVNLACIETASAIYDWATSDEEDFLSGGELDLYDGRTVANVTNLTLTEVGFKGPDGNLISAVDLTWTPVTDAFVELYKVRYNKTGTTNYFYASSREPRVYISGLDIDITSNYDFRVQAENLIGVSSTGTTLSNQALNGDTTAPSAPTSGSATGGIQTITAEWTNPSDIDFKHVEVFVNTTNSIPASPTAVVDGEEYVVTGLSGAATRYFWLKSVDFSGNKSAATASFSGASVVATGSDIGNGAVDSDQIADDAVDITKIANTLETTNFNLTNGTGWQIKTDGTATFNDVNVRGEVVATQLNVQDATISGSLKANELSDGIVKITSVSQEVWNEIESRVGSTTGSTGFFEAASGNLTGGDLTLTTASTKAHAAGQTVYFEFDAVYFWSSATSVSGDDLLLDVKFQHSTDNVTYTTVNTTQITVERHNYFNGFMYDIDNSVQYQLTGLAAGNYYFRVSLEPVGATPNAFSIAYLGVPVDFEVNEIGTGTVATGGNADFLDNIDSTGFLRLGSSGSTINNTAYGNQIFTGDVTVTGTLSLQGSIDQYNVTDLDVTDKTITVNSGNTQSLSDGAGLIVDRGTAADASILWDETNDKFTVTNEVYAPTIAGDDFVLREWTGNTAYGSLAHKNQTGSEYILISRDDHTYISATTGYDVKIRGGNNISTYEVVVYPDQDATASGNKIWHGGDFTSTNISNWDAAYTYSQVGHLPLSGGALTGNIDVTGTVTADVLVVSGDSTVGGSSATANVLLDLVEPTSTSDVILGLSANGSNRTQLRTTQGLGTSSDFRLLTVDSGNTRERFKIGSTGNIQFYEDTGTTAKLTWSASAETLDFADNVKATFGDGDLQIYHSGSASYITDSGTGNLLIQGTDVRLQNAGATANYLKGTDGAEVALFYAGGQKLATSSSGIDVTGTIVGDGLTVDGNGTFTTADNTAQVTLISTDTDALVGPQLNLWRNSGAGTNGDLIGQITFTGEDTAGATNTFATIYGVADQTDNGAEDGSIHFQTLINGTLADRLEINSAGNSVFTGSVTADGLNLGDNEFFLAGASGDLKLGHDGTDNIIRSQGASTVLNIDSNGILFRGYSPYTKHMEIASNGDISFYEDTGTAAKLTWSASNETLTFADSGKAIFGTGSDMSLFHNGNNAFLDNDTGTLFIQTNGFSVKNAAGTESMMLGAADGAVTLYHNNLVRLATSSLGIDVTGDATFSGRINSNSLRIASGGDTADVQEGEEYKYYLVGMGAYDGLWKKVCDVAVGTGLYKALAMKVTLESQAGNFGNTADVETSEFKATYYRSAGTQDSQNNATLAGQNTSHHQLRIIKTATGAYELQILMSSSYRDAFVKIEVLSTNAGTVTIASSIANGSTSGTVYSATASTGVKNLFNEVDASSVVSDSYYVGSQEVITSGRNLTNIGTISASSDIETATRLKFTNSIANGWSAPIIFRESSYLALSDYSGVKLGGYNGTSYGPRFHVGGNGNVNILEGSLMMAGTTVIDASRNITATKYGFADTEHYIEFRSTSAVSGATVDTTEIRGRQIDMYAYDDIYLRTGTSDSIYLYSGANATLTLDSNSNATFAGAIGAGGAADSNYDLKVYGLARFQGAANFVSSTNPIQVGGTTIIDASRNLTNIGAITSSGTITTSGSFVGVNAIVDNVIAKTSSGNILFKTNAGGSIARFNDNLSVEFFGTTLSMGNSSEGNLFLKRPSANYIWADQTAGYLVFGTNGLGTSLANASLRLDASKNAVFGGTINSGAITSSGIVDAPYFVGGSGAYRVKFSVWTGTTYGIGMKNGFSYGGLNGYAMCFQMNTTANRGFWWGTTGQSDAQGAMALTNDGKLTVATAMRLGYGINDGTTPNTNHELDVSGSIYATSDLYADGGNLIIGDNAFSSDANYVGLKTSAMTGGSDYMIISSPNDGNTYISAKNGYSVYIRGGGNLSSNEIRVPDSTYIQVDTNNFNVEGNITAYHSSDESLKENIRVIDSPIEKIKQIRGVYFDWTDDYIKQQSGDGQIDIRKADIGVIAQDVQPVLDEVVTTRKDGTMAVRYEKMIALCIEAIKDQQDQIDSLKHIIEDLENGDN